MRNPNLVWRQPNDSPFTFKELAIGQFFVARYEINEYLRSPRGRHFIAICSKVSDTSYEVNNILVLINTTNKKPKKTKGYILPNAPVFKVTDEKSKIIEDPWQNLRYQIL